MLNVVTYFSSLFECIMEVCERLCQPGFPRAGDLWSPARYNPSLMCASLLTLHSPGAGDGHPHGIHTPMYMFPSPVRRAHRAPRQRNLNSHTRNLAKKGNISIKACRRTLGGGFLFFRLFPFVYYLLPCQPTLEYHNYDFTGIWKRKSGMIF